MFIELTSLNSVDMTPGDIVTINTTLIETIDKRIVIENGAPREVGSVIMFTSGRALRVAETRNQVTELLGQTRRVVQPPNYIMGGVGSPR